MADSSKPAHWKGQSRVNKECHWCSKKQEPGAKAFQACSRCKEVIYCVPCKSSTELREKLAGHIGAETEIARFKKWHSCHTALFRQAAVSALDLGNNPSNADTKALLLQVELKPDHESLPPNRKYSVKGGFDLTLKEARDMLSNVGGAALLDSSLEAHAHMKKKGGLGIINLVLLNGGIADMVRIILPSAEGAKKMQKASDFGDTWVDWIATSLEIGYDAVAAPQ
ncbi:hypothetical protein HYDPIDRAFT_165593 [Hydnomerulius pinastri MD-312]|nr:hypothetical protein HYDPIDRAFT_165593 [Hydnomerulius pinastri MD-312]